MPQHLPRSEIDNKRQPESSHSKWFHPGPCPYVFLLEVAIGVVHVEASVEPNRSRCWLPNPFLNRQHWVARWFFARHGGIELDSKHGAQSDSKSPRFRSEEGPGEASIAILNPGIRLSGNRPKTQRKQLILENEQQNGGSALERSPSWPMSGAAPIHCFTHELETPTDKEPSLFK